MITSSPTLERFLEPQSDQPHVQVIHALASAAIDLSEILQTASLTGATEIAGGSVNATGDQQKKLDLIANQILLEQISSRHLVRRMISEEEQNPITVGPVTENPLLLAFDPMDGSSNIDVNGILASIFGIYHDIRDPLPRGRDLLASGYALYGPSTMFVFSIGNGVHGFTLDRGKRRFVLSHPRIVCPRSGEYFCANVAHFSQWPDSVQAYVDGLIERARLGLAPLSHRYSGAMATDVHRILLKGGMYLYPPDAQHWTGRIRLLYESIPLSFLFEQAGGASSNGAQSLLDVPVLEPHQQDHTVMGSAENVAEYVRSVVKVQRKLGA